MTTDKVIKVKAFIDSLKDEFAEHLYDPIMGNIPYKYDDDVVQFEIVIRKVNNITEQVGVDEDGCRAFHGVEIDGGTLRLRW